jgi:hypothetical protein
VSFGREGEERQTGILKGSPRCRSGGPALSLRVMRLTLTRSCARVLAFGLCGDAPMNHQACSVTKPPEKHSPSWLSVGRFQFVFDE